MTHSRTFRLALVSAAVLLLAASSYGTVCNSSCPDSFTRGAPYAYLEMIDTTTFSITGNSNPSLAQWYTIQEGCSGTSELNASGAFNVLLRATYSIVASTAPVGSTVETQLAIYNGATLVTSSTYTRKIRTSVSEYNRQGEWFNSFASLSGNTDYDVKLKVRLLANGSMTVDTPYVTGMGAPTSTGGATAINTGTTTVGGSWVKLAEASFTNNTGGNIDLIFQSYMQLNSGTAGDKLSIGYGIDNVSSNGHNSFVYVPSYLPDGVNGFDNMPNAGNTGTVSPGTHVMQLWAKNLSGGSTVVQNAQIQGMGFPSSNGIMRYTSPDNAGPTEARTNWTTTQMPQPHVCLMLDSEENNGPCVSCTTDGSQIPGFGTWTKLGTVTFPPHDTPNGYRWIAQGHVELLGRNGTWSNGWAQVAIENIAEEDTLVPPQSEKSIEIGVHNFSVPIVNGQIYFFGDAGAWGTGAGNTLTLWIRKVKIDGQDTSFNVGRAYFGVRTVDLGTPSCQN